MENDDLLFGHQKELQLLPPPPPSLVSTTTISSSTASFSPYAFPYIRNRPTTLAQTKPSNAPAPVTLDQGPSSSLDLQLSISVKPFDPAAIMSPAGSQISCIRALKWQAAEQIRMVEMEKAYAERVRELTRREMELAQAEFSRARVMRERAKEEVDRVEKLKENAIRKIEPSSSSSSSSSHRCFEITCHSCRRKFTLASNA